MKKFEIRKKVNWKKHCAGRRKLHINIFMENISFRKEQDAIKKKKCLETKRTPGLEIYQERKYLKRRI
jgi:hypothetical protein